MAFNTNTARKASTVAVTERNKAAGFLNLYLPRENGKRGRLAGIALTADSDAFAKLIEALKADPEGTCEKLKEALIIEFNENAEGEGSGFVL